jgi:hypothetical protein
VSVIRSAGLIHWESLVRPVRLKLL